MSFSKTLVRERGGGYIEEEREGEGNERRDKYETRNEWRERESSSIYVAGGHVGDILREREREKLIHTRCSTAETRNLQCTIYNSK